MPGHVRRFIEKAPSTGADAICLDLEDSVPNSKKEEARRAIKDAVGAVAKGGSDILVRINKPQELAILDLQASVSRGIKGIVIPKAESAEEIRELDALMTGMETEHGLPPSSIDLNLCIESARGVLNALEVATASKRTVSICVGDEDLCLELGIKPSLEGDELFYAKSKIVLVARAAGITPLGLMGTLSNFTDLDRFRRSAEKARRIGFKGAYCIHPSQVPILNKAFSPSKADLLYARKVVDVFTAALNQGRGAVEVDGRMVDIPAFERARHILEWARAVEQKEVKRAGAPKSA